MRLLAALLITTALAPPVANAGAKEDYELQERCGKRAAEVFRADHGTGINQEENGQSVAEYTNHYNAKLNKCFMLLRVTGPMPGKKNEDVIVLNLAKLLDVNENKEYGNLLFAVDADKPLIRCEVAGKNCKDKSQWEQLIKPYMEQ